MDSAGRHAGRARPGTRVGSGRHIGDVSGVVGAGTVGTVGGSGGSAVCKLWALGWLAGGGVRGGGARGARAGACVGGVHCSRGVRRGAGLRGRCCARRPHVRVRQDAYLAQSRFGGGGVWVYPGAFFGGWGGRIRTFNLLIQSQLRYRCATPQQARSAAYSNQPLIDTLDTGFPHAVDKLPTGIRWPAEVSTATHPASVWRLFPSVARPR